MHSDFPLNNNNVDDGKFLDDKKTIGLTTAIFFLLDSPVLLALLYVGQRP